MSIRETPDFWLERPLDGTKETIHFLAEYRAVQGALQLFCSKKRRVLLERLLEINTKVTFDYMTGGEVTFE